MLLQVKKDNERYIIEAPADARPDDKFLFEVKFKMLAEKWKEESKFFSFGHQYNSLESYNEIIKMGLGAVPLILKELQTEPRHWFQALTLITKENPIGEAHKGNIELMSKDWIKWGKARKLI